MKAYGRAREEAPRRRPHPHERPRCPGCGERLRLEKDGPPWRYRAYGAFHSLDCAATFANRVVRSERIPRTLGPEYWRLAQRRAAGEEDPRKGDS